MSKSAFKELFGEYEAKEITEVAIETKNQPKNFKQRKIAIEPNKRFKLLLSFFLVVIVICLTFIILFFIFKKENSDISQKENISLEILPTNEITIENSFDSFVAKFVDGNYKVNDSGAFAYIYDEVGVQKNGVISLGEGHTYFKNGKIVSFDVDENIKVIWDEYDRKHIIFKEKKQYFLVQNSSDDYYRYYIGQHILQDLINDYLKNKEFIVQLSDDTWEWEWSFYTPINYATQHTMKAEILINLETDLIMQIKLIDNGTEMCVYKFSFEQIESLNLDNILEDYEHIDEINLEL